MLFFCLVDLSIGVSGVLKSPTIIVLLLISPFIFVSICLMHVEELRPPANSCVSEPSWEGVLQLQWNLQTTAALADILAAVS